MQEELRIRALRRAVELCGSVSALSMRIGYPGLYLEQMLEGSEPMNIDVFMRIIDVVIDGDLDSLKRRTPSEPDSK
ncbi:MAG: hypothetical protein ACM3X5_04190 [Bacillota bacterium]